MVSCVVNALRMAEGDLNALTSFGHGDGHDEHPNASD